MLAWDDGNIAREIIEVIRLRETIVSRISYLFQLKMTTVGEERKLGGRGSIGPIRQEAVWLGRVNAYPDLESAAFTRPA